MSDTPPNPCSNCGTALTHCTEMRHPSDTNDTPATACCNRCLLHSSARLHAGSALGVGDAFRKVPPPVLREYAVRNASGDVFPMPSRAYAQHVAEGAPDLQAVSRPVPPWEVLR